MEEKEPVDTKFSKTLDTVLYYALLFSIAGALLKLKHAHIRIMYIDCINLSLMAGLITLALVALIKNFLKKTLDGYITGITLSLACIAVLFRLMHFQGADTLIYLAVASAIVYAFNMAKNILFPIKDRQK